MKSKLLKTVGVLFLASGIFLTLPVTKVLGGILLLGAALCTFVYIAFKPKEK